MKTSLVLFMWTKIMELASPLSMISITYFLLLFIEHFIERALRFILGEFKQLFFYSFEFSLLSTVLMAAFWFFLLYVPSLEVRLTTLSTNLGSHIIIMSICPPVEAQSMQSIWFDFIFGTLIGKSSNQTLILDHYPTLLLSMRFRPYLVLRCYNFPIFWEPQWVITSTSKTAKD